MQLSADKHLYGLGLSSRIPTALAFQNGCEVIPVHRVYLILSVRLFECAINQSDRKTAKWIIAQKLCMQSHVDFSLKEFKKKKKKDTKAHH